jgi:diacylglycerol kinase family enzyme
VDRLHVHTTHPLDVALDGEIIGKVPADFEVAGEALRVITSLEFEDIDD